MRFFKRDVPLAPRREDFDYSTIYPERLPSIMRRHILTGTMGTLYGVLTTGMFLVAFGNAIGVSIEQWGILTAVCSFAIALQMVSAYWGSRVGYRRLIWYCLEFTSRLLRGTGLILALALFLHGDFRLASLVMIGFLSVGSFFAAAAAPVWYSWLADIIPEKIHGSFMGRRDMWISLGAVAVVVPCSYFLDSTPKDFRVTALAAVFCVGLALGIVDMIMHRGIPEPRVSRKIVGTFREQVLAPLTNPDYQFWLFFTATWNFAMFLGGALATVYFLDNLGIRNNFLGGALALIVVPYVGVLLTSRWSGLLIDRVGVKRVLIASHFCWAILPLFWIVATPATALFWLTVSSAVGGAGSSAAVNATNKYILRAPSRSRRAMYLAVTSCLGNLAGGLASLIAGYFLAALGDRHWIVLGKDCVPFDLLFLISLVLRFASWSLLFMLKPPRFDRPDASSLHDPESSTTESSAA
jgi:MFS family permease